MAKKPLPPPRPKREKETGPTKTFAVKKLENDTGGEKVIIYGEYGMGKTTLAALAPKPVFLDTDDKLNKTLNPRTGKKDLPLIPDVSCYEDVRGALQQPGLFDDYKSVVIDTGTKLQERAVEFVLRNYLLKGGGIPHDLRAYGWGEGYGHLLDVMRFILQDLDKLAKQGKNVIIICQNSPKNKKNPGGEDYLKEGPDLYHDSRFSTREAYCSWANNVVKIDYTEVVVDDKKVTGNTTRQIFTKPEPYFIAKSQTLPIDIERITFDDPTDDSFWSYLLGETDGNG